jgi:hypothetical protein
MNIQKRNEELEEKIRKAHENFTKDQQFKFMGDAEIYAFGFWCYLRGLRDRGLEILEETRRKRKNHDSF